MPDSLQPHGLQHARPPCPTPTPGVYSSSCPLSQWCQPTISSSVIPFSSCLQSFPPYMLAPCNPCWQPIETKFQLKLPSWSLFWTTDLNPLLNTDLHSESSPFGHWFSLHQTQPVPHGCVGSVMTDVGAMDTQRIPNLVWEPGEGYVWAESSRWESAPQDKGKKVIITGREKSTVSIHTQEIDWLLLRFQVTRKSGVDWTEAGKGFGEDAWAEMMESLCAVLKSLGVFSPEVICDFFFGGGRVEYDQIFFWER